MPNRLINENSPYLLQHARNPVDWYPWGTEALERARTEDKPIFLSIGYAACHWCHVMAHESFEDIETAAIMNEGFINIKVDREERPDLDSIYMQAVVAMTGRGGWPMSVFLTPDLAPFYGGTYFPPQRRFQMPSFREVLHAVQRTWHNDRPGIRESADQLKQHLQQTALNPVSRAELMLSDLEKAVLTLAQSYDWKHGGWGQAPKFPQPMTIEFLLRRATRGDKLALDMAVHALHAMAKGGMYDVVGGGFARYSTDDEWLVPHFEKMLYDNAQLALVYLHGWLVTGETKFRRVCEETLGFILREMTGPEGGFYSSLDADSEGEEGKFYVWTVEEIQRVLGDEGVAWIQAAYGISEEGNFEGKNVLQRVTDDAQLAEKFGLAVAEVQLRLDALHARLLEARALRIRPGTDDKVLVFWNALMLSAFAEAGRYLQHPPYTQAAVRNARFLLDNLSQGGRLMRSWRNGQARYDAYLEDYAGLALSLLSLYQSDPDPAWYAVALRLGDEMVAHFKDTSEMGGFFDTRDDHEELLYRPKDLQDNATPSGNALAALTLLQLAAYGDRPVWRDLAETMLGSLQAALVRYPSAFAQWLSAAEFALGPEYEVAILGDPDSVPTQALVNTLWKTFRPRQVAAISTYPVKPGSPALLQDRPLKDGRPTAYVCQAFVCQQPVNSPEEMAAQLQ